MTALPEEGTFASDAASGIYYLGRCRSCRRQSPVSALSIVRAGQGDRKVVGSQARWRCKACGNRGVDLTVTGYWTGPWDGRPADWAETVEDRMLGRSGPLALASEVSDGPQPQ